MGELAESMVAAASEALANREAALMQQVRANEPRLDAFQVEIDREAIRLITIYSPVAKDLRFLLMLARINSEFERIGDHAVDNVQYLELVQAQPGAAPRQLSQMAALTLQMVRDALRAFADEDVERARAVIELDDRVDAMDAHIFAELVERAGTHPESVASGMALVLVARSLERIADHATNVCEEVFYLVNGEDIRHQT
jgi:phosphate transport system protein